MQKKLIALAVAAALTAPLSQGSMPILSSFVGQQPLIFQVPTAILIGDLSFYILHRLFHTVPWLWQFHAIHHSSTHIDWLATVRVHPFEQIVTKACQMIPLYWLGFADRAPARAGAKSGFSSFGRSDNASAPRSTGDRFSDRGNSERTAMRGGEFAPRRPEGAGPGRPVARRQPR